MRADPEIPRVAFEACVDALESLETDGGKAALLSGLLGFWLSGMPSIKADLWLGTVVRLGLQAARECGTDEGVC